MQMLSTATIAEIANLTRAFSARHTQFHVFAQKQTANSLHFAMNKGEKQIKKCFAVARDAINWRRLKESYLGLVSASAAWNKFLTAFCLYFCASVSAVT
jgi:hypothetical protein